MGNLEPISLTYGLGANQVFNDRFKRVSLIRKSLTSEDIDFHVLEEINKCDCDELSNVLDIITSTIDIDIPVSKFVSLISVLNGITDIINTKKCYSNISTNIESLIKKMINVYDHICKRDGVNSECISDSFNKCIAGLRSIEYESKNIHEKADVISFEKINEIRNNVFNESTILSTTSDRIYSEANPNGTNIFGRGNTLIHPDELLSNILDSESNEEFISKLPNIRKYFDKYRSNIDADNIYKIKELIYYAYQRLITNNTGLRKLSEELNALSAILNSSKINDFESYSFVDSFREFIDNFVNKINNRITSNENDNVDYDNDIMTEFGFGFLYQYSDDMDLNEAVSLTNKINSITNDEIYDYMSSLQETVREMRREDRYRRKEEKRAQKEQEKYNEKRIKKEQRQRDRDTIKYNGRVLTLTNATARNAMNNIKKLISGIAVGGPVAVVCPQMGLFVGALTILSAFCRSKLTPSQEKMRCLLDLKAELEVIDHKIDEMDREGDVKNKARLIRMKQKMQELYNRFSYTMTSGDLI